MSNGAAKGVENARVLAGPDLLAQFTVELVAIACGKVRDAAYAEVVQILFDTLSDADQIPKLAGRFCSRISGRHTYAA